MTIGSRPAQHDHSPAGANAHRGRRSAVSPRAALIVAGGVASLALVSAMVGQHVLGMEPCMLCIWQRIPFAVAAVGALLAVILPLTPRGRSVVVLGLAFVFAAGAALASYHVGVEEHWWGSIAGCGGQDLQALDFEAMATENFELLKPCDQVDWRFLGLSLAGYNTLLSGGMAIALAFIGWTLIRRKAT